MSQNYTIKEEEPEKKEEKFSERTEKIFESYKQASQELAKSTHRKISITYEPNTEDLVEKVFDLRAAQKPESLHVSINSLYRVRDPKNKNQEYYFYSQTKTAYAANNNMFIYTYDRYGYHKKPVLGLDHNTENKTPQPKVIAFLNSFYLPWKKEEVKKLLSSSEFPCLNFYVGNVPDSLDPIEERKYQIFNQEDFLEGSFTDLIDMGRLGLSFPDRTPCLSLVEPGKKAEIENRRKTVGMYVEKKMYT